jgi:hypothetical protein
MVIGLLPKLLATGDASLFELLARIRVSAPVRRALGRSFEVTCRREPRPAAARLVVLSNPQLAALEQMAEMWEEMAKQRERELAPESQ